MELVAAATGRNDRGIEDDILRMESFVPGLGGAYMDNGSMVVFVTGSTQRTTVLAGLALAAPTLKVDPQARGRLLRGEAIGLRVGQYPFSRLVAWLETNASAFSRIPGVTLIDANEMENRISVGIVSEESRQQVVEAAIAAGIPPDALSISIRARQQASNTLSDRWPQAGSGIQIMSGDGGVCSIGFSHAMDNGTPDGDRGFFTAGHCAGGQPGAGGVGPIYQPVNSPFTNKIGDIAKNPLWDLQLPGCLGYQYCTNADAMFVRYSDPSYFQKRVALTTELGQNNESGSTEVWQWRADISATSYNFYMGQPADKVGRTTGQTRGTISQTCAFVVVQPIGRSPYMVLCADQVSNARAGVGDSGGAVFIPQATLELLPLGIYFSFNSVRDYQNGFEVCVASCVFSFSRWSRVLTFLHPDPY